MENMRKIHFLLLIIFIALFVGFTYLLTTYDIQAVGPSNSAVGLATINSAFHNMFPYNEGLYKLTKYLGYLQMVIAAFFVLLTFLELLRAKSIKKVDYDLKATLLAYVMTAAVYVAFEKFIINYRPVDLGEGLEASYPSSHTLIAVVVIGTTISLIRNRFTQGGGLNFVCIVLFAIGATSVIGRMFCGVHWFTDIVGAALVAMVIVLVFEVICDNARIKKSYY